MHKSLGMRPCIRAWVCTNTVLQAQCVASFPVLILQLVSLVVQIACYLYCKQWYIAVLKDWEWDYRPNVHASIMLQYMLCMDKSHKIYTCLCDECVQCSTVIISSPQIHLYVGRTEVAWHLTQQYHMTIAPVVPCSPAPPSSSRSALPCSSPSSFTIIPLGSNSTSPKNFLISSLALSLLELPCTALSRTDFPNSARILNEWTMEVHSLARLLESFMWTFATCMSIFGKRKLRSS